ncbi:hypothetical protein [Pararhodospirillum photometricum]|nr:hypothetical protein [Pararhodospirillum photometricum]
MDTPTLTVSVPQSLAASFPVKRLFAAEAIRDQDFNELRSIISSIELAAPCHCEDSGDSNSTSLRDALFYLCGQARASINNINAALTKFEALLRPIDDAFSEAIAKAEVEACERRLVQVFADPDDPESVARAKRSVDEYIASLKAERAQGEGQADA